MANNQQQQNSGGGKSNRGFASMDPERQREIASEGGRAAHERGTAHEFDSEEAREAGRNSRGGGNSNVGGSSSQRGGSSEQHAQAGRQSHKND